MKGSNSIVKMPARRRQIVQVVAIIMVVLACSGISWAGYDDYGTYGTCIEIPIIAGAEAALAEYVPEFAELYADTFANPVWLSQSYGCSHVRMCVGSFFTCDCDISATAGNCFFVVGSPYNEVTCACKCICVSRCYWPETSDYDDDGVPDEEDYDPYDPTVWTPPDDGDDEQVKSEQNLGPQTDIKSEITGGDPFNLATGNVFTYPVHDLVVKGRDLAIDLYRTYNSQSDYNGSLGYGWTHSYDLFLLDFETDTVKVSTEDGKRIYFAKNSDGTYTPMAGYAAHSLTKNSDGSYTYRLPQGKQYHFDGTGKLTSIEDRNGDTLTVTRDAEEKLIAVTDNVGRTITFAYQAGDAKIRTVTGPAGRTVTYEYDGNDNLIAVTNPDGIQVVYKYEDTNDVHNRTKVIDENGHIVIAHTYDDQDRVIRTERENGVDELAISYDSDDQTTLTNSKGDATVYSHTAIDGIRVVTGIEGPGCRTCDTTFAAITFDDNLNRVLEIDQNNKGISYTYDAKGNILTRTDPLGNTTTYTYEPTFNQAASLLESGNSAPTTFTYDSQGNLIAVTDPLGNTATHEYNEHGDRVRTIEPNGNVTIFSYDQHGNLLSVTDPQGNITQYSYDILGNLLSVTDPQGNTTSYTYNLMNRVTRVIFADGSSISISYDPAGNQTEVTDQNGHTVQAGYDAADRIIRVADPLQGEVAYFYDTEGNRTSAGIMNPGGDYTTYTNFEYDANNRLIAEIDPDSNARTYTYDAAGNRISATDENGHVTNYEYDANNRLVKAIDPLGGVTGYGYDARGNLTSVTDAKGAVTTYAYNQRNQLIKTTSPDTGTTTYTYDARGNLITKTEANGTETVYTYDPLNRLIQITADDTVQSAYTYDSLGNVIYMTDDSGNTVYEYDSMRNLVREVKTINGTAYEVGYTYDAANRLVNMTYPDGRIVSYERDAAGRVVHVTMTKDDESETLAENISYLPFGPSQEFAYGNGIATAINFDARYRRARITAGSVLDLIYAYDAAGNVTRIADNLNAARTQSFVYDPLARLTKAGGVYGAIEYTYDSVGNRLSRVVNDRVETYAYIPGTNRLAAVNEVDRTTAFAYDANGNTTAMADKEFTYNQNNRLIEAAENGVPVGSYMYNGLGQRVEKVASEGTLSALYDKGGRLIAEADEDGEIVSEYVYVNGQLLAVIKGVIKIEATVDIDPNTLNLNSNGKWITCYVTLPEGYDVNSVDPATIALNDIIYPDRTNIGDYDGDGSQDLTVKFSRDLVCAVLEPADDVTLTVTGKIIERVYFEGTDTIRVIDKGKQNGKDKGNKKGHRNGSAVTEGPATLAEAFVYYFHLDHLGTPQVMTDDKGEVVWQADYLPFGEADVVGTVENNFRFPGQYYDSETGLHYNWFRDYHPGVGRYLEADPIGLEGGIDLFAYVLNNPVNLVDPLGLINWGAVGKGALSAFGGGTAVVTGALLSTTGVGAVGGVPAVLVGSTAFGWGVSQMIVGFADNELPFMGVKEAIIKNTTDPGLLQNELLGVNALGDMLLTGHTAPTNIGQIDSVLQSGQSIYNSGSAIMDAMNGDSSQCK